MRKAAGCESGVQPPKQTKRGEELGMLRGILKKTGWGHYGRVPRISPRHSEHDRQTLQHVNSGPKKRQNEGDQKQKKN